MPLGANYIMQLDLNNGDAISSFGDDLGGLMFMGMAVGIDGCAYGSRSCFTKDIILKYDPINDITSFVGEESEKYFQCN